MPWVLLPEWTTLTIAVTALFAVSAIAVGPLIRSGLLKLRYSKFRAQTGISGRAGMFILYAAPLLVNLAISAPYLAHATTVQWLVSGAVTLHFGKRCLEVVWVHSYSGPIDMPSTVMIAINYCLFAGAIAWMNAAPLPGVDALVVAGAVLFAVGQAVNLAHHVLLARLRTGQSGYFIPHGGLFRWVTTPHYLGEIVAWVGVALMSRHLLTYLVVATMAHYLADRANTTQRWYHEKFPDYPRERRRLMPFVY